MNTKLFVTVAAVAAAALVTGCNMPPRDTSNPESEAARAERLCQPYRSYLRERSYSNVLEECSRQLGEAYCRQTCLKQ
jgi:hypothetical protein